MLVQSNRVVGDPVSPFLKWAGGKRWLVERHADIFPEIQGRYIEPFLGGGSVFFHLRPNSAILSDANENLIECYQQISLNFAKVFDVLLTHQQRHSAEYYYQIRSTKFQDGPSRAAQFIYLNRTCFNGLYRVNMKGQFNVPIGTKDKVIDPLEDFSVISDILSKAKIFSSDFERVIDEAKAGDFLFLDPPYTVKHNFNGFLKYNEKIFTWDDQVRLRDAVVRAESRGVSALLTNAAHASVLELYDGVGKKQLLARSSVLAGKSSARGTVDELVVTIG